MVSKFLIVAVMLRINRVASLLQSSVRTNFNFSLRGFNHRHVVTATAEAAAAVAVPMELDVPSAPAPGVNSKLAEPDYKSMLELASRVINGRAEKAVPIGTQLKRRRSWDLFLGDNFCSGAAILVVNKKSSFSLDDARTALSIVRDEAIASCPSGEKIPIRHLLLATRADVAPVAEVFMRRAQTSMPSEDGIAMVIRWEQLQGLVQGGGLDSYLATSASRRKGCSGLPKAPSFALPSWLLEDRKQRENARFDLQSPFKPSGDQPEAIEALVRGLEKGKQHQTLLGATGTGKTFIVANVIEKAKLPTLVLAPNKVLASQLTNELRALFPNNAVEFFVSYYDYYMPEAFVAASDTYIDKVVQINDDIDRMRHSATRSLLERRDVIVVASVSCIYGLGMPGKYLEASIRVIVGQEWEGGWRILAQRLEQALFYSPQHSKEDFETSPRGSFHTSFAIDGGGVVEIGPASDECIVHIAVDAAGIVRRIQTVPIKKASGEVKEELQSHSVERPPGDVVDLAVDGYNGAPPTSGYGKSDVKSHVIYPAKHHVVGEGELDKVLASISSEMEERCLELGREGQVLEAERLRQRTENDLLLLQTVGTCKGVENYSRHLARRGPGKPPETLVDYFPEDDWLLIVDESHVSAPQLGAMWGGDRARKLKLVDHGFRLPSALDNRPLKAGEFWSKVNRSIFVSATPGKFELELSNPEYLLKKATTIRTPAPVKSSAPIPASPKDGLLTKRQRISPPRKKAGASVRLGWDEIGSLVDAQAVIRPTGITDPPVDIRPSEGQVSDLVQECKATGERGERVLVTALTKRMAEDLCAFLVEQGVSTAYLHSDVKPMQRLKLLQQLRSGEVDVIVGVNLLREGLNLPEVSLVCILDADAEGFLRSDTALLQTIGRATRHQAGRAVLYADRITPAMQRALAETDRRRDIQIKHNILNGIIPSVAKATSVGDSILESINQKGISSRPDETSGGMAIRDHDHIASWAQHSLPPDQVQLLYNLVARNGKEPVHRRTLSSVSLPSGGDGISANSGIGSGISNCNDSTEHACIETSLLVASEETIRALHRLTKQAGNNMLEAASKTDFKVAAMWRDRRDALLSAIQQHDGAKLASNAVESENGQNLADNCT